MRVTLSVLLLFAVLVQSVTGQSTISIAQDGELYLLEARDAPLHDVLRALAAKTSVRFDLDAMSNRTISVRYYDVTLDQMLYRLGVNYILEYEHEVETGQERLARANVFDSDGYYTRSRMMGALDGLRRKYGDAFDELYALVEGLRDDEVRMNAWRSMQALHEKGKAVTPLLEHVLKSGEYQARQMAVTVLGWFEDEYEPSDTFHQVMMEGMHDDTKPGWPPDGTSPLSPYDLRNAQRGYRYFSDHPERIAEVSSELSEGLYSDDGQFRLLCASLLGQGRVTQYAPRIVEVLAWHLADNKLTSDATLASHGLMHLGPIAVSYLQPYLNSDDEQQARYAKNVIADIEMKVSFEQYYPQMFWDYDMFPDNQGRYGR